MLSKQAIVLIATLSSLLLVAIVVITAVLVHKKVERDASNEAKNKFVSSRGLMKRCDMYPDKPVSSSKETYTTPAMLSQLKKDMLLYIPSSALDSFSEQLDHLQERIILVTGDSDHTVGNSIAEERILNSPMIERWYSQNLDVRHPKCHLMPIGLDYHTLAEKSFWGEPQMSCKEQESILNSIRKQSKPMSERRFKIFVNFNMPWQIENAKYKQDRIDAIEQLPKSFVDFLSGPQRRRDTWRSMSEYAFIASPHGNGLDCHRTWEALCLGCIPIVKTSPLDPLYDGMTVWIVNEWSDVTYQGMLDKIREYKDPSYKLTLDYWVSRMKK